MKDIEEIIKQTTDDNVDKTDWTKAWSKKYPVLKTYQKQVDIKKYASNIRKMFNQLQKDYGYSELDAMLVLKDILAHEYLDNRGKNMNSEKELLDNELEKVAGGNSGEITVTIEVPMPPLYGPNNTMEVYIDGQFNAAFSRGIDECLEKAKIEVKGKTGTKSIRVKINGIVYKDYVVDFESGTYSEI